MNEIRAVYAVYGELPHFVETKRSIVSLRNIHPEALVECFTTPEGVQHFADLDVNIRIIRGFNPRKTDWHDPEFKITAISNAAKKPFIFLDGDTYIARPLYDAWSMLARFDIMGVLAPNSDSRIVLGYKALDEGLQVPDAFSEINSGVLFFNNTAETLTVIDRWKALLNVRPHEFGDQWRLRIALYETNCRLCVLPNVFNYRLPARQPVFGSIRIFHGHYGNMEGVAETINKESGYRFPIKI